MNNIEEQYKKSTNLRTRISIHERFSTNKEDWHRWLFDRYNLPDERLRILEIGCGDATFWVKNRERVSERWSITLSDFSRGMVEAAKTNVSRLANIHVEQMKIENIPYEENLFDVVIANHMLYHVPDRNKALSEVRRVLKDGGTFFSSTIGEEHMRGFGDLLKGFSPQLDYPSATVHAKEFGLENGADQLRCFFDNVDLINFPGDLSITDEHAIIDYLHSTNVHRFGEEEVGGFLKYLQEVKEANGGAIPITKSTGLFVSQ
ncbi:class I SAM-dependent methyltransferase [Alkalihalobacillus sp. CinArs1]|uniref:class I SAM-dependent methyltransferase n=1 Tax=Alkalihalobacillus sp. CinArs1 TaxID=2995314 RepID=UPI0022DE56E6|nr:class I SAM-dependent methyltransferase [Alkalihalobacillus sp. CinArs1]